MKIALTGSSGILGSTIYNFFTSEGIAVEKVFRNNLDIGKIETFHSVFKDCSVVIHAAANTDVEACENSPNECFRDNVLLTEMIAKSCHINRVKMIFISSTGIYGDWKTSPYSEFDPVKPTTTYHYSKHLAEQEVLKLFNSLVLRVGWLFGGHYNQKKNFVARRIEEALDHNTTIKSNSEQFGCPTYCLDVAKQILVFINRDLTGIFNCVNEGSASRFDFVQEIYSFLKIHTQLEKATGKDFPRKAKVSNNESAINYKQAEMKMPKMRFWRESLQEYLSENPTLTGYPHAI
jgi:dTDP-4-dehydrorhamnose reductase